MARGRQKVIARAMHRRYEERAVKRHLGYTMTAWEELDQPSREEFLDYAGAIDTALHQHDH